MKSRFEIMKEWRKENKDLFRCLVCVGVIAVVCLVLVLAL
mgnify:CR=1 FL=1